MTNEVSIIITLSLIIFISPLVSRYLKLPVIPIEMMLGSIAITFGLVQDNYIFTLVAELGFLYLMFLAGLEVDLKQLVKIPRRILQLGLIYVSLLYILSIVITLYFGLSRIFIIALPLVSIGLLAALKKEYKTQPWITIAITVGLIGEIISIIILTVTSAMLEFGIGLELYKTLGVLLLVFISIILLYKLFIHALWWYPEIRTFLMPEDDHLEQDIRVSMMIFFIMIALMLYLHLEVALGAFIAGSFVASFFHHNKELPTKLEHFGFGWLVPIFFIWVGSTFNLFSLLIDDLVLTSLLIAFAMIAIRFIASLVFARDYTVKVSMLLGLSHSMPLTLLIAVATLAYQNHSISEFYYLAFILASILEVLVSMLLIKVVNKYI
ncbi:MAG: cation:proton antiporter [Campylobacteraceae bacterium]|jgi:Kef-type K+ transport system membrane component KefB|nr:cation:proton antiporter [Campylobacteraceae bacterium]MBT3883060.1 cation:proton antiporter [Campylobacteraceae bacterium]MBT4030720.1 cation:proton antiporter [Campylobacteraceae bacterium]MBT4178591.1 cation:proton antiporter [Campylobacteraceae bacterium]MBT4572691.1 cation:proton antiporter [Campylobacteraceae bacterium]